MLLYKHQNHRGLVVSAFLVIKAAMMHAVFSPQASCMTTIANFSWGVAFYIGGQSKAQIKDGKIDSIHHHLLEAVSETTNVLELRQQLLYTPSRWWCIKSLFR